MIFFKSANWDSWIIYIQHKVTMANIWLQNNANIYLKLILCQEPEQFLFDLICL